MLKLIAQFATRGNIYVATEKARGALLYTLMQYPQLTLFPPQLEGHRKVAGALWSGGAENDRLGLPPASRTAPSQALPPSAAGLAAR